MGKKLLEIMSDKIRFKHYILSTERAYFHYLSLSISTTCMDC